VALKLGAAGVYLAGRDVPSTYVEGFKVEAVDSTAAGDAFNGAFGAALAADIRSYLRGTNRMCCRAISVTRHGAQSSLPSREDLTNFLTKYESISTGAARKASELLRSLACFFGNSSPRR